MKKLLALALCLLFFPLFAMAENVIVDKIADPNADFAFDEGATLLEIYFPKINGVDAAYVRCGEWSMLIDCGGSEWREVQALLDKLGVTKINYAVNSHPDADHIGGFNHVLKSVACDEFLLGFPEDFPDGDSLRFKVYDDLHKLGIPFRQVSDGEILSLGDAQATVLQCEDNSLKRVNNRSVLLMIQLGERRIFFTGDIQRDAQLLLASDESRDLRADIVKHPHHGYLNMQADFIRRVSPALVILTSGRGTAKGVEILKQEKLPYYFCENGVIRLATDGQTWTIERIK